MSLKSVLILALLSVSFWPENTLVAKSGQKKMAQGKRSSKKKSGVLKLFKKGTSLYEQKKYNDAISVFAVILRNYPSHEPSRVFTAKSYYKLGKIDLAYKLFSQLVPDNLDPETSYEFGQVHLRKKKYSAALTGFRKVPNGHPLFDLASYYGGVCAAKIKDYALSLELMDQAVVLPSKLMKSRKVYQRHAQSKILEAEKAKQKQAKQTTTTQPAGPATPAKPKVPVEGFLLAENTWQAGLVYLNQNQDFSEIKQVSATQSSFFAGGEVGKDIKFGKSNLNSHMHLSAQLTVGSLDQSDPMVNIMGSPQEQLVTQILNQDLNYSSFAEARFTAAPEWNIGGNTWLGIGGTYFTIAPDFDPEVSGSLPHAFISLGQKSYIYSILLRVEYATENVLQAKSLDRTNEFVSLKSRLSERLHLELRAELSQFTYAKLLTDGPDWYNRFGADIQYSFTPNLFLNIKGQYEQVQGNRLHNLPGVEVAGFSQTNIGGRVRILFEVSNWLSVSLNAAGQDRNVQDIEPELNEVTSAVQGVFPTFLTNFYGQIVAKF